VSISVDLKVTASFFVPEEGTRRIHKEGGGRVREETFGHIPRGASVRTKLIGWNSAETGLEDVPTFAKTSQPRLGVLVAATGKLMWEDVFGVKNTLTISVFSDAYDLVIHQGRHAMRCEASVRHASIEQQTKE
jgi:hypothetical protein